MAKEQIAVWTVSGVITMAYVITYFVKTWRNKEVRELLYFDIEDGDKLFNFTFLKKVIFQLITIFLTAFSLVNVSFFCIMDTWVFPVAKSFLILGAIIYLIDLTEKSMAIVRDEKKKRRAKRPDEAPPSNQA